MGLIHGRVGTLALDGRLRLDEDLLQPKDQMSYFGQASLSGGRSPNRLEGLGVIRSSLSAQIRVGPARRMFSLSTCLAAWHLVGVAPAC